MANALKQRFPETAWIDASASVYGDVTIGEGASLWPGVSIRAELLSVTVGRFVNLQDHVMVHIGYSTPTVIGDYASITHRVVLHGCTIGENCLIGIGATIMDGAVIGSHSLIAAGTVVTGGTIIPAGSLVAGVPGVVRRDLSAAERSHVVEAAGVYVRLSKQHAAAIRRH